MKNNIGDVIEVDGINVKIKLNENIILSRYEMDGNNNLYENHGVDAIYRINSDDILILVKVLKEYVNNNEHLINATVIGILNNGIFQNTVMYKPIIGNRVFETSYDEQAKINNAIKNPVIIGKDNVNNDVKVDIENILKNHTAIYASTGSGKSWTLINIISELISKLIESETNYPVRFFIFDTNGEYSSLVNDDIYKKYIKKYIIGNNSNLDFSIENIHLLEIHYKAKEKTQVPYLKKMLEKTQGDKNDWPDKIANMISQTHNNEDSGGYSRIRAVIEKLKDFSASLMLEEKNIQYDNIFKVIDKITEILSTGSSTYFNNMEKISQLTDELKGINELKEISAYDFFCILCFMDIKRGEFNSSNINPLTDRIYSNFKEMRNVFSNNEDSKNLNSLFIYKNQNIRKCDNKLDINIIDLSKHSRELKKGIVLNFISNIINRKRDFFADADNGPIPIDFLVMDEIHNYFDYNESINDVKEIMEELFKEGRKFGISTIHSTQMPSTIPNYVVAQLSNLIVHRINNSSDYKAISSYLEINGIAPLMVRGLNTGECFFVGDAISTNKLVKMDHPTIEPKQKVYDLFHSKE